MITLTLPYPISANRYWASRSIRLKSTGKWAAMTYVTPEAQEYRERVAAIAKGAGLSRPLSGRLNVELDLYPHRPVDWARRARKDPLYWDDDVRCVDLGNAEKVLSDALQGIIFVDDSWHWRILKERKEPDGEGRVVLRIAQLTRQLHPQRDLLVAASA